MTEPTTTEDVLKKMFMENTGRHFLDSGGAYGRNWERNQARDFDSEPEVTAHFEEGYEGSLDILVTRSAYHWLRSCLDYAPEMDKEFQEFMENEDEDESYLEVQEAWLKYRKSLGLDIGRSFGGFNTYNFECSLDQVLQGIWYEEEGEEYLMLQIHGGCDVRGGYTAPRIFRGSTEDFFDYNMLTIRSEADPDVFWDTDDLCHWYFKGICGWEAEQELQNYMVSDDPAERGNGRVYLDGKGNAYCPLTGGKLSIYRW